MWRDAKEQHDVQITAQICLKNLISEINDSRNDGIFLWPPFDIDQSRHILPNDPRGNKVDDSGTRKVVVEGLGEVWSKREQGQFQTIRHCVFANVFLGEGR